jgi:hypothetical protein
MCVNFLMCAATGQWCYQRFDLEFYEVDIVDLPDDDVCDACFIKNIEMILFWSAFFEVRTFDYDLSKYLKISLIFHIP